MTSWCQGRVLLVQASYRRELFEELGGGAALGAVCAAVGAVRALSAG